MKKEEGRSGGGSGHWMRYGIRLFIGYCAGQGEVALWDVSSVCGGWSALSKKSE